MAWLLGRIAARGAAPAREWLNQLTGEINAFVASLATVPMPERQAMTWQLSAEEITRFATEALVAWPTSAS